MNFQNTFHGKKVFLTGHTGFKGSWLSVWLSLMGAKVKGYALKPERVSLYNKINGSLKNHQSVIADIRNKEKLKRELLSFQPDFIFHLAAQPLVRESYKIPVDTFEVNSTGTANLLDALRSLKRECVVIIVTTDKVYKNPDSGKQFSEEDPLGGYDPYSASKASAEIVVESFRLSFFNPADYRSHKKSIASVRAGNVTGGGDYASDRLLPDVFRALSKGKKIIVRNPSSVRPWQHVLDALSGYLHLAVMMKKNPEKFSTSFNFGPDTNDVMTVRQVVEKSVATWGKGSYEKANLKNAPHEAGMLKLDIAKAKKELHWKPKWNSSKAIEKTMVWYKNSLRKNNSALELCEAEIKDYERE